MMEEELTVGIGDMKIKSGGGRLITYALGSCIGISFYDTYLRVGALLHIILPEWNPHTDTNAFKYADSGIRETLRRLSVLGVRKERLVVKIAGGSSMFHPGAGEEFNIGQRNAAMVKRILKEQGLRLVAEDIGGTHARTMVLNIGNGDVIIRTHGKKEKLL